MCSFYGFNKEKRVGETCIAESYVISSEMADIGYLELKVLQERHLLSCNIVSQTRDTTACMYARRLMFTYVVGPLGVGGSSLVMRENL